CRSILCHGKRAIRGSDTGALMDRRILAQRSQTAQLLPYCSTRLAVEQYGGASQDQEKRAVRPTGFAALLTTRHKARLGYTKWPSTYFTDPFADANHNNLSSVIGRSRMRFPVA